MATARMIMQHVTEPKSSQTDFMNMTMASVYFSGLHRSESKEDLWDVVKQEIGSMNFLGTVKQGSSSSAQWLVV